MLEPHVPPQPPSAIPSAKGDVEIDEPNPAQRTVARRTAEARATIPDLELSLDVPMGVAVHRQAGERVSLDALLVAAVAAALRAVPRANGAYRDARFEAYSRVNVGFVIARDEAYLIPTVFDADEKSPAELTAEIAQLTEDALARRLAPPAFSGATFTLWNAGALGLSRAGIVINPPQAAALAAGAVRELPAVRAGELVSEPVATLTLACDHRILYGGQAAAFLAAVSDALQR
ncbi:MAG TPA: 2-oxo acid dehydrogenase subunit E2 [Solirubrobacteraceae bacterium]|nr:2-oxo acid dehydrogenase subunit E2 [Solirubrobacteraceae bacterium]